MAASNYYGYTHGAAAQQYSIQQAPAYSHQSTASYSVQSVPAVAQAATYAPAPVQNPQPVVSQTYQQYQTHTAPDYSSYSQQETTSQPTSTPQNYQVYSEGDSYTYGQQLSVSSYDNKQYYQASVAPAQRTPPEAYFPPGVKTADYRPVQAAYSQPPPQRPAATITVAAPVSSVSTNYSVYSASTSVQQPPNPISTYTPSSSYSSTPATTYSGLSYPSYESNSYTSSTSYYQPAQHLGPQQSQTRFQGPSHQPQVPSSQPPPAQQQTQAPVKQPTSSWNSSKSSAVTSYNVSTQKKPVYYPNKVQKLKGLLKQPQLHYCDICKISCAGPQAYREHLEGQKHKKKEAAQTHGSQATNGLQTQLRCELCDISCTGADAYKAHIRGVKHMKVVKLHTKLGKPIPSTEPVFVNSAPVSTTTTSAKPAAPAVVSASPAGPQNAMVSNPPKAQTTAKAAIQKAVVVAKPAASEQVEVKQEVPKTEPQNDDDVMGGCAQDIQPVGHDYVEEIRNADGMLVRFHCKLCECSFNDPNAKDMHLKGRRHRIQYKKKVNPDLLVEIKPNNRARKLLETKLQKQNLKAVLKRQYEDEQRWHMEMSRRYEEEMYWRKAEEEQLFWEEQRRRMAPMPLVSRPGMPVPPLLPIRRPDSPEDRHIMAKHATIYPVDEELEAVQRIVSHAERALKLVSDSLLEQEGNPSTAKQGDPQGRMLRGVMRVGILAKGLLLHGDRNIQLVLLTAKKPTVSLLNSIVQLLPKQLRTFSEDQYVVQAQPEEASIVIISIKEPKMQVTICLTSPVMREEPAPGVEEKAGDNLPEKVPESDPSDFLNRTKCLEYLAALRHAKWFQARANGLQSCVIIIRILRDLCQRLPTWSKVPEWAMELLVEKAISTASVRLSPGEAMRRVLESIASGILLPDGPGLHNPCERGQKDALESMSKQDRQDVTASAQHALRLLAFRQIHKVLGMDSLLASKPGTRKRRRDAADEGEGEGKKDKKDV